MSFQVIGRTVDQRTNANVVYCKCSVGKYLELIGSNFSSFTIQRKKETHRAYSRLKKDLKNGALVPSITLAIKHHLVPDAIAMLNDADALPKFLSKVGSVDILDGLQRTYIMKEILDEGHAFSPDQELLLEYWLEPDMGRLIYRMIILNAGQKAMSMRHQIELLFMSMKETVAERIEGIDIFLERDVDKRDSPEKYSLGVLASAYQSFMTKTTEINKSNLVADGLNRDNILDSSEKMLTEQFDLFVNYFQKFKDIDALAWRHYEKSFDDVKYKELMAKSKLPESTLFDDEALELQKLKAFRTGIKWFGADNSILSLFCAFAQFDGANRRDKVNTALERLKRSFENGQEDPFGIEKYELIKSDIDPRKSNVGQATRKLLINGFKDYIRDEGEINMAECWLQAVI